MYGHMYGITFVISIKQPKVRLLRDSLLISCFVLSSLCVGKSLGVKEANTTESSLATQHTVTPPAPVTSQSVQNSPSVVTGQGTENVPAAGQIETELPSCGDEASPPDEMPPVQRKQAVASKAKSSATKGQPAIQQPATNTPSGPMKNVLSADVQIVSISVQELPDVDGILGFSGENDVFVELSFGKDWHCKTDVKDNAGSSCAWDTSKNSKFVISKVPIHDLTNSVLSIVVMDKNSKLSADTLIGKASGNLYEVLINAPGGCDGTADCQLALALSNPKFAKAGKATISFRLMNISQVVSASPIEAESTAASIESQAPVLPTETPAASVPPVGDKGPTGPVGTAPPEGVASQQHKPTADQSTSNQPTSQEPASQGPAAQGPAAKEPTAQGPAAKEPAAQGPAAQGPVAQGLAPEESAVIQLKNIPNGISAPESDKGLADKPISFSNPSPEEAVDDDNRGVADGMAVAPSKSRIPQLTLKAKRDDTQSKNSQELTKPAPPATQTKAGGGRDDLPGSTGVEMKKSESRASVKGRPPSSGGPRDGGNTTTSSKPASAKMPAKHRNSTSSEAVSASGASTTGNSTTGNDLKALKLEGKRRLQNQKNFQGGLSNSVSRSGSEFFVPVDTDQGGLDTLSTADTVAAQYEAGDAYIIPVLVSM